MKTGTWNDDVCALSLRHEAHQDNPAVTRFVPEERAEICRWWSEARRFEPRGNQRTPTFSRRNCSRSLPAPSGAALRAKAPPFGCLAPLGCGGVLCALISELGTAAHIREKFRSAHAFASWLGLCPDNRISGGRVLKAKTRKVANRLTQVLRMAAQATSRANGKMGDYVRRFKGRLGKAEGIVAGAHKLARIIWAAIVTGQPYDEAKTFQLTPASAARRLKNLQNQAQALNVKLVPA